MLEELRLFPDRSTRLSALYLAAADVRFVGRYMSPATLLWVGLALSLLNWVPVVLPRVVSVLGYGVFVTFGWAAVALSVLWPVVRYFRRSLRRQLVLIGIPVCWSCGYDLRGHPAGCETCSECGADCSNLETKLQRFLPEAETFPELREFPSESAAKEGLERVRSDAGWAYRHRPFIAGALGLAMAIAWAVVWEVVDAEFEVSEQADYIAPAIVVGGIALSVAAVCGWYVHVWRLIRRGLRARILQNSSG